MVRTGQPQNSPPPPHNEYSRSVSPRRACMAATSRCRNASDAFGKVVKR